MAYKMVITRRCWLIFIWCVTSNLPEVNVQKISWRAKKQIRGLTVGASMLWVPFLLILSLPSSLCSCSRFPSFSPSRLQMWCNSANDHFLGRWMFLFCFFKSLWSSVIVRFRFSRHLFACLSTRAPRLSPCTISIWLKLSLARISFGTFSSFSSFPS